MKTQPTRLLIVLALAMMSSPGCALLSKGERSTARFFTLDVGPNQPNIGMAEGHRRDRPSAELRMGRVTGALHLEERLVLRSSTHEIAYHQDLRWSESPTLYLKRLLEHTLFEGRGLRQTLTGGGPTLDVHLTALDEIRDPHHVARAQVTARLRTHQQVLWEETLTVDRPVVKAKGEDSAMALVRALAEAIHAATDGIADRVIRRLEEQEAHTQ